MDFVRAKENFKEYLNCFDPNDGGIKLKITHTMV